MNPLSRKKRRLSLIGLTIVFILIVPILISYSSGYRFNFNDFGFTKTGGIFIHSDLIGAKVFLDEEFVEDNGLVFRNTLIQNLKSDTVYSIRVEKEDYLPWYKDLIVYPNLVTEAKVLMLPIEIPFEKIEEFLPTNSLPNATSSKEKFPNPEYLNLVDLFSSTTTKSVDIEIETPFNEIVPTTTITLGGQTILLPDYILDLNIDGIAEKEMLRDFKRIVTWLEDGNVRVVWAGDQNSTPFFFCDIRGCRDQIFVSLDTEIEFYDFYPGRNDVLIVQTGNHIFAVEIDDRSKQNIQTIYEGKNPEFKLFGNTIFIKEGEEFYKAEI